jgi:hypothetical protein
MKTPNALILAASAFITMPLLHAQNAPQSIAGSLVLITGGVSVFRNAELMSFRPDGSFQVIFSQDYDNQAVGLETAPVSGGTYTYATSPVGSGFVGTVTTTTTSGPAVGSFQIGAPDPAYADEYPTVITAYLPNALTGAANVSNNSWVSPGHPAISGFVIEGTVPRWVLVRGDGPSLAQFTVPSPVSNPSITVSQVSSNANLQGLETTNLQGSTNQGQPSGATTVKPWSSDPNLVPGFQALFTLAGAFQFPSGSADCATLMLLSPGAYLVTASTNASAGEILTEVYVLPYGDQTVSSEF